MPYKDRNVRNAAQAANRRNKRMTESDAEREARLDKRRVYDEWVKAGRLLQKLLKQRDVNVKIKGVW